MHPMVNIALRAARKAGELIVRSADQLDSMSIEQKDMNDYVTKIDKAAEKEILYHIQKAYPEHSILAEESGEIAPENGDAEYCWVIDPLDGTRNFIQGIPHYAVSIACLHKGKFQHAVIYDPVRNEEFVASRGQGAQLNGRRIRVTDKSTLDNALLLSGLPSLTRQAKYREGYLNCIDKLQTQHQANFRNEGSAALSLAYLAAGRADAYWEPSLKKWDMAAGILLVQEAGGMIADFAGGADYYESGNVVATNKKCFKPMLQITRAHLAN